MEPKRFFTRVTNLFYGKNSLTHLCVLSLSFNRGVRVKDSILVEEGVRLSKPVLGRRVLRDSWMTTTSDFDIVRGAPRLSVGSRVGKCRWSRTECESWVQDRFQ